MKTNGLQRNQAKELTAPHKLRRKLWLGLAAVIIVVATVVFLALHPTKTQQQAVTTATTTSVSGTGVDVKLNQKQLAAVLNYAVKKAANGTISYKFVVGDYVTLVGTTKILGASVSFSLQTTPSVTTDGNILLKAQSVNVGSLSVPLSYIMQYVKQNYNLPSGISIDTNQKTILLNLAQLTKDQALSLTAVKINNTTHEYYFKVGVPE